ncbi:ABC transporter permease [Fulvivirga ligni]|uniref:ABC transporter permease n=1 Tax=Fulvivirga ligni TaxID=2904246 RepID=UPI001F19B5D2|nr:ABC transporter permease [Fulvivirga ligni]UII22164.1 ABC transporter permease [Fulvivirga ligni]
MQLNDEHINYIISDLRYRGVVLDGLDDELIDHICILVEQKMDQGLRFIEAYQQALKNFGHEESLLKVQHQTLQINNNSNNIMFKNHLKIALRNLAKYRFYSVVNILGLSVGLACCLIIALFVSSELSYDSHHVNKDRIYRLSRYVNFAEQEFHYPVLPAPLGPALMEELPEVESAVRFRSLGHFMVSANDQEVFSEGDVLYADNQLFDVFTISISRGNAQTPLTKPNEVAISESAASKYFGSQSPIGKILKFKNGDGPREEYAVTAVFQDIPSSSHLSSDFFLSMPSLEASKNNLWFSNNFFTYVLVRPDVDQESIEAGINRLLDKHLEPEIEHYLSKSLAEFRAEGGVIHVNTQPLDQVYLHSNFLFDIGPTGNITYVYLFSAVAIFILIIACINFMNLSTARSANRAKEVGVRKVLGSLKGHLMKQFLTETILMCLVAFMIALAMAGASLPFFNYIAAKQMVIPFQSIWFWVITISGMLMIGVAAGLYPAFVLSAFKPSQVLKGKWSKGAAQGGFRSALVVFQFFVSILLIIATAAVYKQLNFIHHKKLGYNKDQIIIIHDAHLLEGKEQSFRNELLDQKGVNNVTISSYLPVRGYNRVDNAFWPEGQEPTEDNLVSMQIWNVDDHYIPTMEINMIMGRNLKANYTSDSSNIILNESAFKKYGFTSLEDAAVSTYDYDPKTGGVNKDQVTTYHVVGVVEDFHFESLRDNIAPAGLRLGDSKETIAVNLKPEELSSSLESISETWSRFNPESALNYSFLNEDYDRMYRSEERLAKIFTIFSGLAIFIGCLGLLALAAFMADQRTKEIGIRKVLGASVSGIMMMLSKEFGKLIAIAFVIAAPLAWWGITKWLATYSYKVEIGPLLYFSAGILSFVVACITVGYIAFKAAVSNPVNSLRSE